MRRLALLSVIFLLALSACRKEVLTPVFTRSEVVSIPQEGGRFSVAVTYTKAEEYAGFSYRVNIGSALGGEETVSGRVDEIAFDVPANETYETRKVTLAVNTDRHWTVIFSAVQACMEKPVPLEPGIVPGTGPDDTWQSAADAVTTMRVGWNLGNTLDANGDWIKQYGDGSTASYETAWGQPVTKPELLKMFADAGFGAIRVPVTWYQHMDAAGKVDEAWMARVEEVVNYVLDAGMYCVLNVHHDTGTEGWMKADAAIYQSTAGRFKGLWRQIAERFRDYGEKLVFEGYNEILDASNYWNYPKSASAFEWSNKYNQDFVNVVRESGGNNSRRNLVCVTYCAGAGADNLAGFELPADTVNGHLIAEVHSYAPYLFAFDFDDPKQGTSVFDAAAEKEIEWIISCLKDRFTLRGIPCIIGEYGAANKNNMTERCKQASCYVANARAAGITCFHWMGLSDGADRSVPKWTEPALRDAILAAAGLRTSASPSASSRIGSS